MTVGAIRGSGAIVLIEDCRIAEDARVSMLCAAGGGIARPRDDADVLAHVTPDLEPVVRDWQESPSNIYGHAHLTATFSEYLAESYARFLSGKLVPDATRRFLQSRSEVGVY